jgi:hypothetical protein
MAGMHGGHRPGSGRKRKPNFEERVMLRRILTRLGGPDEAFAAGFEAICYGDGKPKEKLAGVYFDNLRYLCDRLWGKSVQAERISQDGAPKLLIIDFPEAEAEAKLQRARDG